MAITVPVPGTPIATAAFGIPVANALNGIAASGVVSGTTPSPFSVSTTPTAVGSVTIPNLPMRAIIIARASFYVSSQTGLAYLNIGVRIAGGPTRYWRGLASDVPSSWHIDAYAALAANAGPQPVDVLVSGNASGSVTLGGTSDYNAIQAAYICTG